MEKILNSFKFLYAGEDTVKKHLLLALLFLLPSFATVCFQAVDKDEKAMIIPLLIAGGIFLVLSILPMIMLCGIFVKFLNRKFLGQNGIPEINMDILVQGAKVLPVYLVWGIYIGLPVLIYLMAVFGGFTYILTLDVGLLFQILLFFIMFGLVFLLAIPLFIITPFITMIYIKYATNLQYSSEIFNPLTPFRYMKIAFKDALLVALKYFVVSIGVSFVSQIIGLLLGVLLCIFVFIGAFISSFIASGAQVDWILYIPMLIGFALYMVINSYAVQIVNFAYANNLADIYKEKVEPLDTKSESYIQMEDAEL